MSLLPSCVYARSASDQLSNRNMFLAAAPYFAQRFQSDRWAESHYQSSILSVSTITNLGALFVLAKLQKNASYPRRIILSLLITVVVFTLLAVASVTMQDVTVGMYFGFLMVMVFGASLATGINQNGSFAYVSGFGREEYTQAIMGGQGVAGVLPCVAQIISVLAVSEDGNPNSPQKSSKSAFIYFTTAVVVALMALVAFLYLVRRQSAVEGKPTDQDHPAISDHENQKAVSLWALMKKLRWMGSSVFLCFAVTMVFPVFTAEIESVNAGPDSSRFFEPAVFIPVAFLFWNVGDLIGRTIVLIPRLSLAHRPRTLLLLTSSRIVFIPLYLLCNIRGHEPVIRSDFFYLFVVQLLFGVTNGYFGSTCMMGASQWVSEDEREASGAFMSLMLVGGLAAGSILSFLVAGG